MRAAFAFGEAGVPASAKRNAGTSPYVNKDLSTVKIKSHLVLNVSQK